MRLFRLIIILCITFISAYHQFFLVWLFRYEVVNVVTRQRFQIIFYFALVSLVTISGILSFFAVLNLSKPVVNDNEIVDDIREKPANTKPLIAYTLLGIAMLAISLFLTLISTYEVNKLTRKVLMVTFIILLTAITGFLIVRDSRKLRSASGRKDKDADQFLE